MENYEFINFRKFKIMNYLKNRGGKGRNNYSSVNKISFNLPHPRQHSVATPSPRWRGGGLFTGRGRGIYLHLCK
jgi:hypothetical protein